MESSTQLTSEQRYQIYALNKKEHSQSGIARVVGVHKPTISRELRRNSGGRGYRPKQAHRFALQRRDEKVRFGITGAAAFGCTVCVGLWLIALFCAMAAMIAVESSG